MPNEWVDVTVPLRDGLTPWPGDVPYALTPTSRIADGDPCNVSSITLSTHTGTHVDAPWHFEPNGATLDTVDVNVYFGPATLLDFTNLDRIRAEDLEGRAIGGRVVLKTRHSGRDPAAPFDESYPALEADGAQWLVDQGVRLVGIDSPSIAPFDQAAQDTHHILLQAGVLIVEGLRLHALDAGTYELAVLPLALSGADGAPCRAFMRKERCDAP